MALSMTGYGRGIFADSRYNIVIDIKTINHRFLEVYCKLPKTYLFLEDKLRREISNRLSRGKVELTIAIEKFTEDNPIELNKTLAASYLRAIQQLQSEFNLEGPVDIPTLLSFPEIIKLSQPEENQEQIGTAALQALQVALDSLVESRRAEGQRLMLDLTEKIELLESFRNQLIELAPTVVKSYQERLVKRVAELTSGLELDPNRLAAEVALFADKSDISEELVRLASHLQQFALTVNSNEPIGRRLDFLVQELNREINTVGSKANELKISQLVIEFKSELEKIREQIQNIE